MSKIARNPINVPSAVNIEINGKEIKTKGPKGELVLTMHDEVDVKIDDGDDGKVIMVSPKSKSRFARAMWGTTWSLINNNIIGVNEGYKKQLEIQGVGYRANMQGNKLVMQLGFSHDVEYDIPEGITVNVDKQTSLTVEGIDKRHVGQTAAEIRAFKPPEPYKGKGIRYKDEYVIRKEGKKK